MNYNYIEIGERIARERKRLKMNQDDFIYALSLSGVHIGRKRLSKIENGNKEEFDFHFLISACELFNCDMGYLLGEYDEKIKEVHDICEYTSLSEKCVNSILSMKSLYCGGKVNPETGRVYRIPYLYILDKLMESGRFPDLAVELAKYLIHAEYLPSDAYNGIAEDLSTEEHLRFVQWANSHGKEIYDRKEVCDMHLQNAADELKHIFREVLENSRKADA